MASSREIVLIHLGAGQHDASKLGEYRSICKRACLAAVDALVHGNDSDSLSNALHGVIAAISVLEDDPNLNCGYGSNLTWDQTVECDASVMDGKSSLFGAVGAIEGIRNPIKAAAALIQEQTKGTLPGGRIPPMFLCGANAFPWFESHVPSLLVPRKSLISTQALSRYHQHLDMYMKHRDYHFDHPLNHDTVGAIVMDRHGHIAAGVSSGGISLKHCGRVGEAAMYGAGCWAQNETGRTSGIGVSCSGTGEQIMQALLAKACAEKLSLSSRSLGDIKSVLSDFAEGNSHIPSIKQNAGVIAFTSNVSVQGPF